MALLDDVFFDAALNTLIGSNRVLHICSAQPTSYANVAAVTLGNKATPSISSPADRTGGGREVSVTAITDGSGTGTGTATHWALVDTGASRLIASQTLNASQTVTNGNEFTLTSFAIGVPDPA